MADIRVPSWLVRLKKAEHQLRAAYLRSLPTPVLRHVDGPLRRLVTFGRRAAAAPFYLRQPLERWEGGTGRVAVWSARYAPQPLFDVLFDEPPTHVAGSTIGLGALVRRAPELAADCDVVIVHATPALAPWLRRAGFRIVPGMVRFGGDPAELLAIQDRATNNSPLIADIRRMRRADYRVEEWAHTPERSRLFYERYLDAHARVRFGKRAEIGPFEYIDRYFKSGLLLALVAPGRTEPDALGLVVPRGNALCCVNLGIRDSDPAIMRAGGMAALYRTQMRFAQDGGWRMVDFGRCLPWASDGVYQYKWKWGLRPIPCGSQTLEFAVKVLRPEAAVARRLVERGVIVREGTSFRPFTSQDLGST